MSNWTAVHELMYKSETKSKNSNEQLLMIWQFDLLNYSVTTHTKKQVK